MLKLLRLAAATLVMGLLGGGALAQNLKISTGLPDSHYWVGQHMKPLIDAIKEGTGGGVTFTPFYDGKLMRIVSPRVAWGALGVDGAGH